MARSAVVRSASTLSADSSPLIAALASSLPRRMLKPLLSPRTGAKSRVTAARSDSAWALMEPVITPAFSPGCSVPLALARSHGDESSNLSIETTFLS